MEPPRWNAFPSYSNSLLAPRELAPPNSNPSPPPRNLVAPARFLWHKPRTLFPPSQSRSLESFFPQLELFVPLAISPLLIRMFSSQLELCSSPSTFRTPHSNSPPPVRIFFSPSRYRFPSTVLEFFLVRSTIFYFIVQRSSLHRTLPPPLEVSPPQTEPFFPNSIFVSFRIRISLNSNISPDSIYFRLLRHFAVPPQIAFPLTRTVGLLFKVRRSWPRLWCGHGLAPCSWLWIAPLVPSLVAVCFVATVHPWLLL